VTGSAGDLASVVADLAGQLPSGHITAWARVLRSVPGVPPVSASALAARLIDARPGFAMSEAAERLISAWQAADPAVSGSAVALALESAAQVEARADARRGDVVISGPAGGSAAVRLTSSVISELIHDCRESLLVVSFAAFGVAEVVHELSKAAQRGVRIDLILESTAGEGGTLHGAVGAAAVFADIERDARFWIWPGSNRPAVGASRAALHAKLIAADERVALVGSANLTDKALAVNLELGVIIRDPEIVGRIVRHFRSLMQPGAGVLEPFRGGGREP
jgi:putative cardiolipin synthase